MLRITTVLDWFLRLPLVWGGLACMAFYALLLNGYIDNAILTQYCTRHGIEYVEVSVFFVGLAALVMRCFNLTGQFLTFDRIVLDPIPAERQKVEDCGHLLAQLNALPASLGKTYLARRLWDAIAYVRRVGSADTLEQQLRHLEEQELNQVHSGYSMVRIIVWAIPILGLLGTVIGITMAVSNLNPKELEDSTAKVTAGLGIAFDHTATALTLTMILMFIKAAVERVEDRLLARVDTRVSAELVGRFEETGAAYDPNVVVVRRMSEEVLAAVESLAERQANVWKTAIEKSNLQWADVSVTAGKAVKDTLAGSIKDAMSGAIAESVAQHAKTLSDSTALHADKLGQSVAQTTGHLRDGLERLAELLVESLHRHGEVLTMSEKDLAEENRKHLSEVEAALGESMVTAADRQERLIKQSEMLLKEMQVALVEAAGATVRQQEQLVRQGDILLSVVDATGQVKMLETTLNQNLATLRQGYHFEELALNLSAAIQLLCARLGHLPASSHSEVRVSQAA